MSVFYSAHMDNLLIGYNVLVELKLMVCFEGSNGRRMIFESFEDANMFLGLDRTGDL